MTRCPRVNDRRIVDVEFRNSTNDGALCRQIGSDASGWVLGNRSFYMLTLAEKKTPDLDVIELAVRTPKKSTWRANCRIAYPASPPGVCPAVDL